MYLGEGICLFHLPESGTLNSNLKKSLSCFSSLFVSSDFLFLCIYFYFFNRDVYFYFFNIKSLMLKTFLRGVVIPGYPLTFKIEYYKTDKKLHQERGGTCPSLSGYWTGIQPFLERRCKFIKCQFLKVFLLGLSIFFR